MSFKGLKMLKIPKLPDFEKYWKSSKNIQRGDPWKKNFFSFLFNTLFYTRQSYKTIRMSFGGLRMLKSPKLTQCYSFASVGSSFSSSLLAPVFTRIPYYYVCIVSLVSSVPITASVLLSNAYLEISRHCPSPCVREMSVSAAEKPEAQINEWRLQRSSTKPGGGWWLVAGGVLVTRCKECWANCYKWCMGWVCRLQLGRLCLLQHCRYPVCSDRNLAATSYQL